MRTDLSTRQVAILRKPKLGCVSKPQSRSKPDGHRALVFLAIVLLLILALGLPIASTLAASPLEVGATKDSYGRVNSPTSNYGTATDLRVSQGGEKARSWFEFDISAIPAGQVITSATLSLYYSSYIGTNPSGQTVWAYKLIRIDWVESEVTWNIYKTGSSWTTAGGDYVTSDPSGGSTTFPGAGGAWLTWNVTDIVQDAYDSEDSVEILIRYNDESPTSYARAFLNSKENASNKPKLTVVYETPAVPPTVVTIENPEVDKAWANLCGNITDIGSGNVTHRGFQWGTAPGDYTWNWGEYGSWNETGQFCYNATTGITCSDTFYFRAFAANDADYSYGDEESFNTTACDAPTVETNDATGISYTTATVHGNITVIDGPDATTRGFEYDTDSADPPFTFDWHEDGTFGTGTFEHELTSLTDGQLYYFRAYATGPGGTGYGSALNFTTWAYEVPTVATFNATDIGLTYAFLSGNITYIDGLNATIRGFEWDIGSGDPYANNWTESGNYTTGTFSYNATGLPVGSLIYFRAIAYNAEGWGYGAELNFTTMLPLPLAPTNFTAIQSGTNEVVLNWTMGVYAATTIIRGSTETFPATITDGYEVYNGAGTNTTLVGLSLTFDTYYYSAWSENPTGLSLDNAEVKIGGDSMIMLGMLLLPLAFTFAYLWKRDIWQGIVACLCWVIGAIFFMQQSAGVSPMDMVDIWMALFWICMLLAIVFAFAPFVWRKSEILWQEEEDDSGWGDPSMVMYKNGVKTNKQRDLTDLEVRDREQRIKAEQSRPVKRKSDYPRQVLIHKP